MKELSNYYRKKLFRGGALTPEQATTLADLESKKLTTTLSPEEQTDYDSLVAMRDAVEPPVVETSDSATSDAASSDASSGASNTMGAPGVEAGQDMAPTETDANPAEGASLFDTVSSAVGSAVNTVKGAVGMETQGGNQRRKSNKRNNKRRNSKRQSRRQRR